MAFQRVPNTVEIDIIYSYNGELVQNVFYAEFGGAYAQANLQSLADEVDITVDALWLPVQPVEAVYLRTEVRGLNIENDFTATQNLNTGPGLDISSALPNNVTFSIKRISPFSGRSARGRTYWIGISEDKLKPADENRIIAADVTAMVAALDAMRAEINTVFQWTAVIVSRFTGGVKRAEGVTFDWIGTVAVDDIIDTRRGRLPR